ncbi:MAG: DUF4783 domain-containing protein [Bacteroidales bacterium]|nr:DUF4783 domain-containing protein [Bacteroidales bacterium]
MKQGKPEINIKELKNGVYENTAFFEKITIIKPMKRFLRYPTSILIFFWLLFSGFVLPQRVPTDLSEAIKNGNSAHLASFFSSSLELVISENDNIYEEICSKTQAEMIISNFFAKNRPTNFDILHEGSRGELVYATGKLTTFSSSFNVTFLIRIKNGKEVINQLRIEQN